MSSTTIAAEASLGTETIVQTTSIKVLGTSDQGRCGFEPRWWCLDLSVSGNVLDASAGGPRPGTVAFDSYPGRAPFILRVSHGVLGPKPRQPGLGVGHTRYLDTTSGHYFMLASSVQVDLVGPPSLRTFSPDQPGLFNGRAVDTAVGRFQVSLSPVECAGPRSST